MKKVFCIISVIAMFTACNFTQAPTSPKSDSISVDSVKVDSIKITTIVIDSVTIK